MSDIALNDIAPHDIRLVAPDGDYVLVPTLSLVGALEREAGLLDTAEKLLAGKLPVTDALRFLRACYGQAGCAVPAAELDALLLARSPLALLAGVLAKLLAPLAEMGLAQPGKRRAARRA